MSAGPGPERIAKWRKNGAIEDCCNPQKIKGRLRIADCSVTTSQPVASKLQILQIWAESEFSFIENSLMFFHDSMSRPESACQPAPTWMPGPTGPRPVSVAWWRYQRPGGHELELASHDRWGRWPGDYCLFVIIRVIESLPRLGPYRIMMTARCYFLLLSAQFWSSCHGTSMVRAATRDAGFESCLVQAEVTRLLDRCPRNRDPALASRS